MGCRIPAPHLVVHTIVRRPLSDQDNPMRQTMLALLAAVLGASALAGDLRAQQPSDSTRLTHLVRTRDGSTLVGRLVDSTADSIRIETRGGTLSLARADIAELRQVKADAIRDGVYWVENPNPTRLFFAPTGRMLERKEGYFSDTYLLFVNVAAGVTSRITMGGGMSLIPSADFSDNLFYLTPKVGLVRSDRFNLAAGALVGIVGFDDDLGGDAVGRTFGIAYGVATVGSRENSATIGAGVPFAGGRFAKNPALMIGGESRVARRASLVTENYFFSDAEDVHGLVSYGVRFLGERMSVDLAFWNVPGEEFIFPGIPYVAFSVKF